MLPRLTVRSTWFRALRPPNCISTSLATSRSPPSSSLPLPLDGPGPDRTASSRGVCRPPPPPTSVFPVAAGGARPRQDGVLAGGLPPAGLRAPGAAQPLATHKTDDAVLQVIDDEQNHQAQDGQAQIGYRL